MISRILILGLVALLADSPGAGTSYRFRSGEESGTVWLLGDDARLEADPGDSAGAGRRVMISKNGGEHRFVLDTTERTYYDEARRSKATAPTVDTLTVREPFVLAGVSNIQVDVRPLPRPQSPPLADFPDCQPVAVSFSYDLKANIEVARLTIPGRVKGVGEYCFSVSPAIATLPFGHAGRIVSGIAEVDASIAAKLAPFKGTPVHRTLTVSRQMEGGEEVSLTKTLDIRDVRRADVALDRFAIPEGFRYQEPVITPPVRQEK